ncbi:NADH dehydrogenase [Clostridium polyendosporum]|uniref:NADH dehydrogenase n=1 Tax=Clostridium polyendosporum TaxID=69208 RepID=A0A919RX85_9CLOT|nr:NADH-quinone oxidoreductase subunit NuoF [Clostridium polyendosporum]GIM28160.1 NADH dehydrogenase [Clostridium polyendosporum]
MNLFRGQVLICGGTGCSIEGAMDITNSIKNELKKHIIENEIEVIRTGCLGLCELGPIVMVYPEGTFYSKVNVKDVAEIVEEHLVNGRIVKRLAYFESLQDYGIRSLDDVEFYKKQVRIALRNCGVIDPENIDEYLAVDGYKALEKVLTQLTPQEVIEILKKSGLRGRGGGGFPTGLKWELAAKQVNNTKYIICNADEGDPGAFMDRSVLEGDPHAVLEAMAIGGYAIGASEGYIYVRAEYPLAVERLKAAIKQAREYGLLGDNVLGTDFKFNIDIRLGAGAFVCGEETALMNSIEGKRGMPNPKPPFPAQSGLWKKPSVINNVETFANIAQIILKGADWFSSIGTQKSKGTKVFALGGKITNTGLVEVPMGITLREVIYDIGGGIPNGKSLKAVQTGGPSGGCITTENLDVPIDYDTLSSLGSMMGSGGMIVLDEDNCMVDVARFYLDFVKDESCGKCTPCRIGTKRMLEILEKITTGKGTLEDLEKLEILAKQIKVASLCGLGQTAPNPVLSTLKYFRDEYIAHVVERKCPAGVCAALVEYSINPDKCRGCSLCARQCPVNAISGKIRHPYNIDQSKCVKCGSCVNKCPFKAIEKK